MGKAAQPTVKLRHVIFKTDGLVGFYDGSLRSKAGVIEVPVNKDGWLMKAWREGFQLDEDGNPVPPDVVRWAQERTAE